VRKEREEREIGEWSEKGERESDPIRRSRLESNFFYFL
jgi:hypothetical protein